jgi:transposase
MTEGRDFAAWIGLDWADKQHWICMSEAGSDEGEIRALRQEPQAVHQWVSEMRARFGGRAVALAVEQSRGPLIYALMQYDFIVLFPINPKAFASYRKALRLSGARNDPSDARLLWQFLKTHHQELRAWQPEEEATRALRWLVEQRRELVESRTRELNRLTARLKDYYPQALQWFPKLNCGSALEFLKRWPSLQQAQQARRDVLGRFFARHRISARKAQQTIRQIRREVALTEDPAVLQVYPLRVEAGVDLLASFNAAIARFDEKIQSSFQSHPDAFIFASFVGAGSTIAPRLLAAFGTDRRRWNAYDMQCFSGIAAVTEQSGDSRWVHHRKVCPKFLKQTFHEFARCSIPHSAWARAYYQQQRERGARQHEAIRALAYKWIRILYRCWKDRTEYCEDTYLAALSRSRSPLIERINRKAA